jgi:hypothetical protein
MMANSASMAVALLGRHPSRQLTSLGPLSATCALQVSLGIYRHAPTLSHTGLLVITSPGRSYRMSDKELKLVAPKGQL